MKKQQSGFTLIELIMVIVVLGILAAFALPRFADLGSDARVSAVQGAAGAIKSASAIAHSAYLMGKSTTSTSGSTTTTSVDLEGKVIALVNGYPSVGAILDAAQISQNSENAKNDFDVSVSGTTVTVKAKNIASGSTTCQVSYTEAANSSAAPNIAVDTTSCK